MSWQNQLRKDSLPWLLGSDNPGVRYLALCDLLDLSPDDRKLKSARKAESGQFTSTTSGAPSGTIDCLQGNLCWSLMEIGYDDPRLQNAYEWMARTVTGDGIAPMEDRDAQIRYYAHKCGPSFACGVNNRLPCAWGGVKVMLAFSKLSTEQQTPLILN